MAKGGRNERKFAKILSLWLTDGDDKTQLIRSKQSGGWSVRKENQTGDLAPNGPKGAEFRSIFVVEVKARETFHFFKVWSSKNPPLWEWWQQVVKEGREVNQVPMLVYSKNYAPNLVGLPVGIVKAVWSEERHIIVEWGELDGPPLALLELDVLLNTDPGRVIQRGKEFTHS